MAGDDLLAFLDEIDAELARHAGAGEVLDLHLLGRSALVLGYGVALMTKDVDVVHVAGSRLLDIAADLFRRGAPGRLSRLFYLETVSSGLPPLPGGYQRRCTEIFPGRWRVIRPKRPEVHDLVATKLRRFHRGDREDIRILCDTGDVDPATLRERFESAYAFSDRDDPRVISTVENLQVVLGYLEGRRSTV